MSGLRIWEIQDTLTALFDTREGADNPEVQAQIDAQITETLEKMLAKVDDTYRWMEQMDSQMELLDKEIARLKDDKARLEKCSTWVEGQVKSFLNAQAERQMSGRFHTFSLIKNPPSVVITDEKLIPSEFKTIVHSEQVRKTDIKRAVIAGQQVPGATLVTDNYRLERK